jgi:D-galactarolactone cycloisomerase
VKITGIRLERRTLELDPPFLAAWDPEPRRSFEATLVFVETDEGITGVGSGDTMDGFERYEHLFLGEDARDIERHVRVLETIAFHAARYWPLEAALWDVRGKAEGKPVAELLGGEARRLRVYASTGELRAPEQRAEDALALREQGFRALKLRVAPDRIDAGLATVAAVRDAVGDSMEIAVDLNQGWRMPGDVRPPLEPDHVLTQAHAFAELGLLWLEEPLPTTYPKLLADFRAETGIRVAGGEMVRDVVELDTCLAEEALDVYQPDAVLAVGLLRAALVALRAFGHGHSFTPHTWTNGIGLLANLHLCAGVGGGPYLEFPYDPPSWTPERRDFMLAAPIRPDADGFLEVPDRPGLGIELSDDAL